MFNWSEVHFYRSTSYKIHTLVDLQLDNHGHFSCLTSHQISMSGVEESAEFFNQDDFSFTCQIISITVQLSENQHNAAAAAALLLKPISQVIQLVAIYCQEDC